MNYPYQMKFPYIKCNSSPEEKDLTR